MPLGAPAQRRHHWPIGMLARKGRIRSKPTDPKCTAAHSPSSRSSGFGHSLFTRSPPVMSPFRYSSMARPKAVTAGFGGEASGR